MRSLRPHLPPPPTTLVNIFWYSFEGPSEAISTALSPFGEVKNVAFQRWSAKPTVSTGTHLVRMVVRKEIPRLIVVNGIRCKVWYKGQPLRCDICRAVGHKSASCPDKGKCFRCHQSGHLSRSCPLVWGCFTAASGLNQDRDDAAPQPVSGCEVHADAAQEPTHTDAVEVAAPEGDATALPASLETSENCELIDEGDAPSQIISSGGFLIEKEAPVASGSVVPDQLVESIDQPKSGDLCSDVIKEINSSIMNNTNTSTNTSANNGINISINNSNNNKRNVRALLIRLG